MPGQPQLLVKHSVATVSSPSLGDASSTSPVSAHASQFAKPTHRPVAVPIEEAAPASAAVSEKTSTELPPTRETGGARRVDLNHATLADLEALPGIGPKLAQRVIEHRDENGPFRSVDDLRQVKGIGRKKFDRLRPHVLVTNTKSLARHKGTL
ncbi:MAG: helix-hairpin-helix domain-containing protein [Nitrospira sp.]|nr:helix-hairpin-helix domain-containing protein [Nitrospira sp.]